jgi:hypothetical protein
MQNIINRLETVTQIEQQDVTKANHHNIKQWKVLPLNTPKVKKNCPKCGYNATFINTKKFRVNANKRNHDNWLIYQCEHCKSTWNMTIYERVNPEQFSQEMLERFSCNDLELAYQYGFDRYVHKRNKAEQIYDHVEFTILDEIKEAMIDETNEETIEETNEETNEETIDAALPNMTIVINCPYDTDVKLLKILSCGLDQSVSALRKKAKKGYLTVDNKDNVNKEKLSGQKVVRIYES